jgi:hypothetical protein
MGTTTRTEQLLDLADAAGHHAATLASQETQKEADQLQLITALITAFLDGVKAPPSGNPRKTLAQLARSMQALGPAYKPASAAGAGAAAEPVQEDLAPTLLKMHKKDLYHLVITPCFANPQKEMRKLFFERTAFANLQYQGKPMLQHVIIHSLARIEKQLDFLESLSKDDIENCQVMVDLAVEKYGWEVAQTLFASATVFLNEIGVTLAPAASVGAGAGAGAATA